MKIQMDNKYLHHPIFTQLSEYAIFYETLAGSVMGFLPLGLPGIINIDSYVYSSMRGTLESIKEILEKGRINDAYTLLRKFYDAAVINLFTNLYLNDHFNINNFVVEKIDNWVQGKEKLPDIRKMNDYLSNSNAVKNLYQILIKGKKNSELRKRCNDHTHYNFYYFYLLNDGEIYLQNRLSWLNQISNDLEYIIMFHLSLLFHINGHYMSSTDYVDCLDAGLQPEPGSQYWVAPYIQNMFDKVIKKNRPDVAKIITENTSMKLI